jgi:hypothetical protein
VEESKEQPGKPKKITAKIALCLFFCKNCTRVPFFPNSSSTFAHSLLCADNLKQRDATEEGWTSADGKESVTKRTIRQVTTTHSDITGKCGQNFPFFERFSKSQSLGRMKCFGAVRLCRVG